jgi:1,4-dihydroxy-6-naphthoate synthase
MTRRLSIAYSPCPNDTFVFHAWQAGRLPGVEPPAVTIADIDVTNDLATRGELDILKISYAALPYVLDRYALLPCGGALGHGCGPLVLTRDVRDPAGERSTAYLLFRLWAAQAIPGGMGSVVLPFHEIMPAVRDGRVDAGLVIHEARFTYAGFGLNAIADLGVVWESMTGRPLPLGAIVARRALGPRRLADIADTIRASVRHAWADPTASRDYVREHAQELAPEVAERHISLYVNDYTENIGETGYAAVRELMDRLAEAGMAPAA